MKLYSIGIDPGEKTGFAVNDRDAHRLEAVITTDFLGAIRLLTGSYHPDIVHRLLIEIPHKNDGNTNNHVWHDKSASKAAVARVGLNVGRVLREAELLIKMAEEIGYNVVKCNPMGKTNKAMFKRITGWPSITNQHERDAGMLVWGM